MFRLAKSKAIFTPVQVNGLERLAKRPAPRPSTSKFSKLSNLECVFLLSILLTVQFALMPGSYSGKSVQPMHGDYEAQRHWMEITYHLPINDWYVQTEANDLLYWGLDYPPLTAYHSYAMGVIAHRINASWVALQTSRGIETREHLLFMRLSAILPFLLIYAPAILYIAYRIPCLNQVLFAAPMLLYPGLIAMDNAHFQYNSISLGFFLWAYAFLAESRMLIGSVFFVLAVNYKQMELYHALPIFVYILARCVKRPLFSRLPESFIALAQVGLVVIVTFLLLWFPFLRSKNTTSAVLQRIFPFYRGLFEDKVASFWCAFSFLIKFNKLFSLETQIRISTLCVILASLPSLCILFMRPSPRNLRFTLLSVALAFFLFSFQVHEKSILLPATAALLLLPDMPYQVSWFLTLSSTSMYSLCLKDGNAFLLIPFVAYGIGLYMFFQRGCGWFSALSATSQCVAFIICLLEIFGTPPASLPHLFSLLNAFFSCCHFLCLFAFVNIVLICGVTDKSAISKKYKSE